MQTATDGDPRTRLPRPRPALVRLDRLCRCGWSPRSVVLVREAALHRLGLVIWGPPGQASPRQERPAWDPRTPARPP